MRRWRVRQPGLQQSARRRRRTCHYPCQCFVGASQAGETRGEDREFGAAHATADRAGLPAGSSGADQAGEKGKDLIAPGCPGVDTVTVMLRHDQADGGGTHRYPGEAVEWPAQFHQARPFILEYLPDCPAVELRLVGSPRAGDARLFPPGVQLGQALHPGLGAEQQIAQIAGLVLNLAVRATHAAFGHGSPEPQPEAGVPARSEWCEHTGSKPRVHWRALPTKIASTAVFMLPQRPRRQTPPWNRTALAWAELAKVPQAMPVECQRRGRKPVPGSRGRRRAPTASGCAAVSGAPPRWSAPGPGA
jgi:hypothetical protein